MNSLFNPQNYYLNIYALPNLLVGFLVILEGIFVLFQSKKKVTSFAYFLATLTSGIFLTGAGIVCSMTQEALAIVFSRYCSWFGIIFVTPSVYFFSASWKADLLREKRRTILVNYFTGVGFYLICIFSHYLVEGVYPYSTGYFPKAGLLEIPFIAWFCAIATLALLNLMRIYREANTAVVKKNTKLMFIAFAIAFIGSIEFLHNYGLPAFPIAFLPMIVFTTLMGYCILRYNLFDVESLAYAAHRDKLTAIGVLAASINHEVKNPLFIIKGLAESCLERQKEGVFPSEKKALESANDAMKRSIEQADRAMDIIKRLSLFAKAGIDSEIKFEPVNVAEVIEDVLPLVRYELAAHGIALSRDMPPNLPEVRADRRYLEEILFNLVVNACQAVKETGKTGEIVITAKTGDTDHEPRKGDRLLFGNAEEGQAPCFAGEPVPGKKLPVPFNGQVVITIQDTGPGIPSDKLKDVFRPFYTTKAEGTGLGLYITQQLVEKIRGRIDVQSEVGVGTTFTVSLQSGLQSL